MARLTITLDGRDHYALKLLAIRQNKRMVAVVDDAIKSYLQSTGAYDLNIAATNTNPQDSNDDPGQSGLAD